VAAHRVIILGGGFGGLYAARALGNAPVQVTLIDVRNFHLFQPLLYQVATGSLSPGEICAPLRSILWKQKNTEVLLGEAVDIDPHARIIQLRDGGVFPYNSLIVATGSETSYFGHEEWRQWAPSLKSVEEATAIRTKVLFKTSMGRRRDSRREPCSGPEACAAAGSAACWQKELVRRSTAKGISRSCPI
jgi:NADH dehydrogenase